MLSLLTAVRAPVGSCPARDKANTARPSGEPSIAPIVLTADPRQSDERLWPLEATRVAVRHTLLITLRATPPSCARDAGVESYIPRLPLADHTSVGRAR